MISSGQKVTLLGVLRKCSCSSFCSMTILTVYPLGTPLFVASHSVPTVSLRYQSIRRTITNSDRTEESPVDLLPEPDGDLMPHSIAGQFTSAIYHRRLRIETLRINQGPHSKNMCLNLYDSSKSLILLHLVVSLNPKFQPLDMNSSVQVI